MFYCIACGENQVEAQFHRCGECLGESLDNHGNDEPIGSCDECGANLYAPEDIGQTTCDQCQWWIQQANS